MNKEAGKMPFGKYKGKAFGRVPISYMSWLIDTHRSTVGYPELTKYLTTRKVFIMAKKRAYSKVRLQKMYEQFDKEHKNA